MVMSYSEYLEEIGTILVGRCLINLEDTGIDEKRLESFYRDSDYAPLDVVNWVISKFGLDELVGIYSNGCC